MNNSSLVDTVISWPSIADLFEVLTLNSGYNSTLVILGTTFLGIAGGMVGTFALLRKRSMMGDALAHSTLPGLALIFILAFIFGHDGRSLPLLLGGATVSAILAAIAVQGISSSTRLHEDTAIGAVLSVFFGLGITLLSVVQSLGSGSAGGLHHFIYGQTAAINFSDAVLTSSLALLCLVFALLFIKEFGLVAFDEEFAQVQGWPTHRLDLLLMALVTAVTVTGLQSVGLLLIVAILIVPAAAARFWTESLPHMILLGACFGGLSGYLGGSASSLLPRLPAGSVIVLASGVIFALSFSFAPKRGLCASIARKLRIQLKIAEEHFLRAVFERQEYCSEHRESSKVGKDAILRSLGINLLSGTFLIALLKKRKLISLEDGIVSLTPSGLKNAKQLVRNHRLWEEYILSYGSLASSHVDYSADLVEHVLNGELIKQLEKNLEIRDVNIDRDTLPTSRHQ